MSLIAELITEGYGERCADFEPDCWCCKIWAEYDRLVLPAGWKAVPIEPTEEMIIAGCHHENLGDMAGRYRAMLAAAPEPAGTKEGGDE